MLLDAKSGYWRTIRIFTQSIIVKVRDSCRARQNVRAECLADALTSKVGTLSLEAQTKLEKDTAKKEAKAEAKAEAEAKKKQVRPPLPLGTSRARCSSHPTTITALVLPFLNV